MKETSQTKMLHFRVSPRTMQMLGRENISSPVIGVLELVKNAYDADATQVRVIFRGASTSDGEIIIEDDGNGMEASDFENKWLVISTDDKKRNPKTRKGRIKVGEKGIGRLALDRLCKRVEIISHTIGKERGLKLEIDWTKYELDNGDLHQIEHPLSEVSIQRDTPSGTILHLMQLRDRWTQRNYEQLYNDLALLVPPFDSVQTDFTISFECDEAPELSGEVTSPMVSKYEYKLESTLSQDGSIHHVVTHRSGQVEEDQRSWYEAFNDASSEDVSACGPLRFILYFYLRDPDVLKELQVTRAQIKTFLDQFQGIRIYRDNFRVKPYGDPQSDDWLGLNLRQVRNPAAVSRRGWVVGGNQVVGSIFITRLDNPDLQDQTNREGLFENEAYYDMRKFALHGVQFLERTRYEQKNRQSNRKKEQKSKTQQVEEAFNGIEQEISKVTTDLRSITSRIAEKPMLAHEEAHNLDQMIRRAEHILSQVRESEAIYLEQQAEEQTERQLLLGLATLGIAMTTFGHETARTINMLINSATLLKEPIDQLPEETKAQSREDLQTVLDSANKIRAWGTFALERIRQDKRNRKNIDLNRVIKEVVKVFEIVANRYSIVISLNLSPNLVPVRAFTMDVEAIVMNLLTNAIEALKVTPLPKRIEIETNIDHAEHMVLLTVSDSGRGIRPEDREKIFDPMFSTKVNKKGEPIGTGMGLTIIQNLVDSYQGSIEVESYSWLGGASFLIKLPYAQGGTLHHERQQSNGVAHRR